MTRTSLFSFHSTSELNSFRTISAASDSTGKVDFTTDTVNPDHIQISDSTVKRLKKVAESGEFLRVMIDSGGCKGFNYVFKLDTQLQPDDRVFERDNAKVVVDADSLEFLKGTFHILF